jgi:hypothetical protein
LAVSQRDALTGVQLPDLMRGLRAPLRSSRRAARLCRLQVGGKQVSLQGARAGQGLRGVLLQDNADISGTPCRVFPAEVDGCLTELWLATAAVVSGLESIGL